MHFLHSQAFSLHFVLFMSKPKVLVIGSGGVGAIAALALTLNGNSETTLVVRSHYQKVIDKGFRIRSVTYPSSDSWRPNHVNRSVEEAAREHGPFDYVVLTTKNIPDGTMPCEEIVRPAVVNGKTAIVLFQNGIEIEKPMFREYPDSAVISGILMMGSTNIDCVVTNGHKDTVYLGPFHNPNISDEESMARVVEFASLYQNEDEAVNKVIIEESALQSRWDKLLYNSVYNTICTVVNLDVNRCQITGANDSLFSPAMDEIIAIAASEGIVIDEKKKDFMLHVGDGLFYSPSMLVDYRKKQLFEIEVILGNPIKIAQKNGVPTPILSTTYHLLKMIQFRVKEEIGMVKIEQEAYKAVPSEDYPKLFEELSRSS